MDEATTKDPAKLDALLNSVLAVGSDLELASVLERIVKEATSLVGSKYGALGVLTARKDKLANFITVGIDEKEVESIGDLPSGKGVLGLLISDPQPIRLTDISHHERSVGFPDNHPIMKSFLGVPIRIRGEAYGNLYLCEKLDGEEFTEEDESLMVVLATAAAIAIDNARLLMRVRELTLAEDRERIARDLHDTVIQRLFAVGLSLQSVAKRIDSLEIQDRIRHEIDHLDETIRQVRATIFDLDMNSSDGSSLRAQFLGISKEAERSLGFKPQLSIEGPVDSVSSPEMISDMTSAFREALSNVAKHAAATEVTVRLFADAKWIGFETLDNGVGIGGTPTITGGRGVHNMHDRARTLGGKCEVASSTSGGTLVTWQVPVE